MNAHHVCLLIDDNYIDNFVNQKLLEINEFADQVVVSQNPQEAIISLRTGDVKPDVIFLDIRMDLMDGFEFLKEYDEIDIDKQNIKIFMLSSSIDARIIKRAEDNKHITEYICKPLTMEVINELRT
jgi:response regulator RpfG family c-di-GMP phosphodiesterase